jgi:hypothetical protein
MKHEHHYVKYSSFFVFFFAFFGLLFFTLYQSNATNSQTVSTRASERQDDSPLLENSCDNLRRQYRDLHMKAYNALQKVNACTLRKEAGCNPDALKDAYNATVQELYTLKVKMGSYSGPQLCFVPVISPALPGEGIVITPTKVATSPAIRQ